MAQSSNALHEDPEELSNATIERHRAIVSLMEELEAVDWYDQRVEASGDEHLKAILAHNRDEEKEHAAMTLEWLRRNDAAWDAKLREYLFTEGDVTQIEEQEEGGDGGGDGDGSLGIGSLKGAR